MQFYLCFVSQTNQLLIALTITSNFKTIKTPKKSCSKQNDSNPARVIFTAYLI